MTPTQAQAVRLLACRGPMSCSSLGSELWGRNYRKPQSYARPAGALLKKLRTQGFVIPSYNRTHTLWRATAAGLIAADDHYRVRR